MQAKFPAGALNGIRVIDLSRVLGGPYCTQMLGDHGADVIKIEPPQGDETRAWGPPFQEDYSSYYMGIHRNKRTMALDIATDQGRAVLLRLLANADVLVENFKAGTMEKWGIGYADCLATKFPRLIHCRITGFGADGPMGAYPGYDAMVQAWAGLQSVNGAPESGPVRLGIPIVDLGTGMNAMIGILLAINERHRSGQGQFVDCTLYDTAVALLHPHAPNWFLNGQTPKLYGNSHGNLAPYNLFKTKGLPIVIGAGNDGQFRKLCAELGRPELAQDARFATNRARLDNLAALTQALGELLKDQDGESLAISLMEKGVPAGAVRDVPSVLNNPHTKHRHMVVQIDDYKGTGIPVKLSRTPGSARSKPMHFGAANRAILQEAGYGEAEIDALIEDGIVPSQPKKV